MSVQDFSDLVLVVFPENIKAQALSQKIKYLL